MSITKFLSSFVAVAFVSGMYLNWAVPEFQKQQREYVQSSQCIQGHTDNGTERNAIVVYGAGCSIK